MRRGEIRVAQIRHGLEDGGGAAVRAEDHLEAGAGFDCEGGGVVVECCILHIPVLVLLLLFAWFCIGSREVVVCAHRNYTHPDR